MTVPGAIASGWLMREWLTSFAYRIELQWWVFGAAVLLVLLVCAGIVSTQVLRALRERAVEGLREE
jgi:putative ABC transport system permease protein